MGGKEAALAPNYAAATFNLVAKAAGAEAGDWLSRAAARRGLADPQALAAEAAAVRTRDQLMASADSLYQWRLAMATGDDA